MKRALATVIGAALVCAVAYLSWLNPTRVDFYLSPARTVHDAPLAALLLVAFSGGALLVLLGVMVQAGRRALATWRRRRQERRVERIEDWEERGEQLVWSGDTQRGRALLDKAWRRRPESAHAVLALAESYRDTGELQRARQLLTEAANQHHTNPEVLLALAEIHRMSGAPATCTETLERLRALHPHAPRALRALRDGYVDGGRWRDAASLQESLLSELRDPDHAARERELLTLLRYQSAMALADLGARAQALEALADSRAVAVPILVSLGDTYVATGRHAEASVLWERTLRSSPRTVFVERLACMASEPHHRERLRSVLRKLRNDQVNGDNARLLMARIALLDGDAGGAAHELESLHAPEGAPPIVHRLWADVHSRRGHQERAVTAYARADGAAWRYQCRVCQHTAADWTGYCPQCRSWDSYRSEVEIGVD